jgi:L-malate glycosyltransferase
MNIYFIENENPSRNSSGGIMTYLVNLSKYLISKNIKTTLLGNGIFSEAQGESPFVEYKSISKQHDISNTKYLFYLYKRSIKSTIKKNSIIHVQRPDMCVPLLAYANKNNCLLVCSLHGIHNLAVHDKKSFIHNVIYYILQTISFIFVKNFIAVDNNTKQYYSKKYPWAKKKIIVIPIGVDTVLFSPLDKRIVRNKYQLSESEKILIFIGRLEKEKNIPFILNSFKKVKEEIVSAKLIIVGDGNDKALLRKYVSESKIKDVVFFGEINNTDIPNILNCADVFVFASLYEGSPNVIKEAIACNIPVISTDVGDVKNVLDGVDNCYIVKRDEKDFSKKILLVLSSKKANIREKVLKYNCNNVSNMTLELYKSLSTEN